jgi:predicted transposase/invertase (TIGR01784 family)
MLMTEWNLEDAKQVWYEEGMEEGLEKGLEKGREEGLERGREEGREEIARNALAEGVSIEIVRKITGLDIETIKNLGHCN